MKLFTILVYRPNKQWRAFVFVLLLLFLLSLLRFRISDNYILRLITIISMLDVAPPSWRKSIPVVQSLPVHPGMQEQVKVAPVSEHEPPFLHGPDKHGFCTGKMNTTI